MKRRSFLKSLFAGAAATAIPKSADAALEKIAQYATVEFSEPDANGQVIIRVLLTSPSGKETVVEVYGCKEGDCVGIFRTKTVVDEEASDWYWDNEADEWCYQEVTKEIIPRDKKDPKAIAIEPGYQFYLGTIGKDPPTSKVAVDTEGEINIIVRCRQVGILPFEQSVSTAPNQKTSLSVWRQKDKFYFRGSEKEEE